MYRKIRDKNRKEDWNIDWDKVGNGNGYVGEEIDKNTNEKPWRWRIEKYRLR